LLAGLEDELDHLSAALHAQFLIQVVDVVFHRVAGNIERILDLLVALAL
jgi:hypothetical protein